MPQLARANSKLPIHVEAMLAQAAQTAARKTEAAPERTTASGEDGFDACWWERVVRVIGDSVDEDYEPRAYPRRAPVVAPAPDPAPASLPAPTTAPIPSAPPLPIPSGSEPRANTNPPLSSAAKTKPPLSPPGRKPLQIRGVETTEGKPKPGASTVTQSPLMPLTPLPVSPKPAAATRGAPERPPAPKPATTTSAPRAPIAPDNGIGRRLFWFGAALVALGAIIWWVWPTIFSKKPAPAKHAPARADESAPVVPTAISPAAAIPSMPSTGGTPTIDSLVPAEVGHSWDFGGQTSWDDPANPAKTPPVNLEAPPALPSAEPAVPVKPVGKPAEPAPARPEASSAFLERIAQFKINGVRTGNPVRAIINGSTFFSGDFVDPKLGLRFVGLDAGGRRLIFEDLNGARAGVEF